MFLNKLKNNKVAERKIKLLCSPAPYIEILFMIFYPTGGFFSLCSFSITFYSYGRKGEQNASKMKLE